MTPLRTIGSAALLCWTIGLVAYTLLPLPDPDAIRCATPQLRPLGSTTSSASTRWARA